MLIVEMAGGILTGLLFGFALAVVRPVLALVLTVAAAAVALVLVTTGVAGLLDSFGHVAAEIGRHAPFFAALAVGKLIAAAVVLR